MAINLSNSSLNVVGSSESGGLPGLYNVKGLLLSRGLGSLQWGGPSCMCEGQHIGRSQAHRVCAESPAKWEEL